MGCSAASECDPPHRGGSEEVICRLALSVAQCCPHGSGGHPARSTAGHALSAARHVVAGLHWRGAVTI